MAVVSERAGCVISSPHQRGTILVDLILVSAYV